jgi:ferric-dicitrate binding protein FerR (iron transport regulator)
MRSLTREQIELLAEKKLSGTIAPDEQEWLNQWLDQEAGQQMTWYSGDPDERAFRERLLKRIKEDAGISGAPVTARRVPLWPRYRWSAAAAILLLIAGSLGYFLIFRKDVVSVELASNKKAAVRDIAPGHNGAILTLANGQKIILDSAGNGGIAIQGNRLLVKKRGQLVYEKATGTTSSKNGAASDNMIYNTLATPRGREYRIVLSDGTEVWLNAASSITYPTTFTGGERKVILTGEAYFEVAGDSRRPFIVSVSRAEITVLGTHFDVMAYRDEKQVKTTLLEGAVRVSRGSKQVVISPGQQASFSTQSDHIEVATVDTKQTVAWVEGKLSLDNLDVGAIMRKVSRWYNVDVTFDGPIPDEQYWGLINRNVNLSDMLKVMRATGINATLSGKKIVVSTDH